jgi:hypothetical protein
MHHKQVHQQGIRIFYALRDTKLQQLRAFILALPSLLAGGLLLPRLRLLLAAAPVRAPVDFLPRLRLAPGLPELLLVRAWMDVLLQCSCL